MEVKKKRTYARWHDRWTSARKHPDAETFFYIASSYVNVDILEPEWFKAAIDDDLGDLDTGVLSIKAQLESGEKFYANIAERHFYRDGIDETRAELFGINDKENCDVLRHLKKNRVLEAGMDFEKMMSMTIGQPQSVDTRKQIDYKILKFIHTLSPDWIRELGDEFLDYFESHKEKVLHLYYDRAANNYKKAKQDLASQVKKAIEYSVNPDTGEEKRGWRVVLMSENQGNIGMNEEYIFMQELLSGNNFKLPNITIDMYAAKSLKCFLEMAPTKKNRAGHIVKEKKSENIAIHRLPWESTNPSDSFKYLMMRREWRNRITAKRSGSGSDPTVRGQRHPNILNILFFIIVYS